jgi:hypothetical protein
MEPVRVPISLLIFCSVYYLLPLADASADENGSGEERPATGLASRTSGLKQRPYSMQVSEVSSSGSEVQQVQSTLLSGSRPATYHLDTRHTPLSIIR